MLVRDSFPGAGGGRGGVFSTMGAHAHLIAELFENNASHYSGGPRKKNGGPNPFFAQTGSAARPLKKKRETPLKPRGKTPNAIIDVFPALDSPCRISAQIKPAMNSTPARFNATCTTRIAASGEPRTDTIRPGG